MKIVTLLGLMIFVIALLSVGELNESLTTPSELASESVIEVESSENEFDCAASCLTRTIALPSKKPKIFYSYKSDSILFNLSKDLFRPPSLA